MHTVYLSVFGRLAVEDGSINGVDFPRIKQTRLLKVNNEIDHITFESPKIT